VGVGRPSSADVPPLFKLVSEGKAARIVVPARHPGESQLQAKNWDGLGPTDIRRASQRAFIGYDESFVKRLVNFSKNRCAFDASKERPPGPAQSSCQIKADMGSGANKLVTLTLFEEERRGARIEEYLRNADTDPPGHVPARLQTEFPTAIVNV